MFGCPAGGLPGGNLGMVDFPSSETTLRLRSDPFLFRGKSDHFAFADVFSNGLP
jgi:hypothetical protein